jgi:hypothetical protein
VAQVAQWRTLAQMRHPIIEKLCRQIETLPVIKLACFNGQKESVRGRVEFISKSRLNFKPLL